MTGMSGARVQQSATTTNKPSRADDMIHWRLTGGSKTNEPSVRALVISVIDFLFTEGADDKMLLLLTTREAQGLKDRREAAICNRKGSARDGSLARW
jgi:hypothetical protein